MEELQEKPRKLQEQLQELLAPCRQNGRLKARGAERELSDAPSL